MADRSSAALFGEIFGLLAEHLEPGKVRDQVAKRFWEMSRNYDFNEYQMYCDDDLIKLGLAHRGIDARYPEDGECVIYEPPPPSSEEKA